MDLIDRLRSTNTVYGWINRQAQEAADEIERRQARIDALMLEYCPDEMTTEQVEEWGRNQRPVSDEEQRAIESALGVPNT